MAEPLPLPTELISLEDLQACITNLLETESWDILTLKVVLARLEHTLLPDHPPNTLKPFKKGIMEQVNNLMKAMMIKNTEAAAPTAPEPQPQEEPAPPEQPPVEEALGKEADPMEEEPGEEAPEAAAGAEHDEDNDAPPGKRRKLASEEEEDEEEDTGVAAPDEGGEAEAATKSGDDDDDDLEDDPDAPRVVGKPTHKSDGKAFYQKMVKGDEEIKLGQDVYLENNLDIPYVARLTEIFVYSFAPTEVYFNARWYYRKNDVHEYAKMAGAKADVQFEGGVLEAEPKELFFSCHMDENHADCILRSCAVHYWQKENRQPPLAAWDVVNGSQHEFLSWRAYDNKSVYALSKLTSKKLREECELEAKRGPQDLDRRIAGPAKAPKPSRDMDSSTPLLLEELRSIVLPRKHLEVWEGLGSVFNKVAVGSIVRISQMLNGRKSFFAAYVIGIKRAQRPYKIRDRMTDVTFQVRTKTGNKMVDLMALSNLTCTDEELTSFKVPLDADAVRKKMHSLQRAMQDHAEYFEAEDLKVRMELEEQMRQKYEEEARVKMLEEEERERKEREREEVRRRAAAKQQQQPTEAWWLQYNKEGDEKEREIAKLKARLTRFNKIAASSSADGERENAERLAAQAQQKLDSLLQADDEEEADE